MFKSNLQTPCVGVTAHVVCIYNKKMIANDLAVVYSVSYCRVAKLHGNLMPCG